MAAKDSGNTNDELKTYSLYVYCRHRGLSRDAGLHAQCEADNDATAIAELRPKAHGLYRYYDTVFWNIYEGHGESKRKVK